jgi:hypothetical protein
MWNRTPQLHTRPQLPSQDERESSTGPRTCQRKRKRLPDGVLERRTAAGEDVAPTESQPGSCGREPCAGEATSRGRRVGTIARPPHTCRAIRYGSTHSLGMGISPRPNDCSRTWQGTHVPIQLSEPFQKQEACPEPHAAAGKLLWAFWGACGACCGLGWGRREVREHGPAESRTVHMCFHSARMMWRGREAWPQAVRRGLSRRDPPPLSGGGRGGTGRR